MQYSFYQTDQTFMAMETCESRLSLRLILKCEFSRSSSIDTMKSHLSGSKHQKKIISRQEDLWKRGRLPADKVSDTGIRAVPNPPSAKTKIPLRLHEKVRVGITSVLSCMWPVLTVRNCYTV